MGRLRQAGAAKASVLVLSAALAGTLMSSTAARTPRGSAASRTLGPIPQTGFFDLRAFARALDGAGAARPAPGARAAVVPHHWFAGPLIVDGLRALAGAGPARRVILVGPNHIGTGGAAFITSARPWDTPFGTVRADASSAVRLTASGLTEDRADVLALEHSIAGLIPAIARFFPGASVVPIAVAGKPAAARLERLSEALSGLMDPETVIVASVDFSHYRSAEEATARNAETVAALRSLDAVRLLGYGNEHLDSPGAIAVLLGTMKRIGARAFELRASTDSTRFGGSSRAPNVTSYIEGFYRPADPRGGNPKGLVAT